MHQNFTFLKQQSPYNELHVFPQTWQAAQKAGASRIFAIDINAEKFELARKWGATDCINPKDFDKPIQQVRFDRECYHTLA